MSTLRTWWLVVGVLVPGFVQANPARLTQQGRLLNIDGTPASGTVSMNFAVYASSTGGTALWTEAQSVTLDDGYFVVQLGSVTPFPTTLWSGASRFVGLRVGSDSEMTPREEITSVPYALMADGPAGPTGPTGLTGPTGPAGASGPMGYAQTSSSFTVPGGVLTYNYPIRTMAAGTATHCSVAVVGFLAASPTGTNQTFPVAKVSGGSDATVSYGCYFPTTTSPWSTCAYTWVTSVTPGFSYDFGCALASSTTRNAFCAVAVDCH